MSSSRRIFVTRLDVPLLKATGRSVRADGEFDRWLRNRYVSWSSGIGAEIEASKHDFKSLEKHMLANGDITPNKSGRQERLRIW